DRQLKRQNIYESQDNLLRSLGEYLRDRSDTLQTLDQAHFLEFYYNGKLQYVQITPYHDQYGLNWRIVTVLPKSHFTKAIQGNTQTTVLLCLLTLGVAIMLGLIADELLIERFMQLNQASQALAAGNLEQRLLTNQPIYELNGLAQTFNQMADQLQHSFNRIHNALEESEEKFTTIFRTSPDPMAIASLAEGRILEANDSLVQLMGYSRTEMIGRPARELNFWSNLEQRDQYSALLQQQVSVRNLEAQLQIKSGEVKTVLLSAEVYNLEGQDRLIVMFRDISDRKAAELALQQSEARYRAIVEDQTELIVRFLPDTTLVFVNEAYCRYFGIHREDVIGKSYNPCIYEADRDRVVQLVQSMGINRPTVTIENRVVVAGEVRWTQWINRLLFDDKGNITEIQSVGRDITELKQTEEALRKSEANLLYAQQIAHVGSWEIDLEAREHIWSEEFFHILGLDPTQLESSYLEFTQQIPIEDRDAVTTAIQNLVTKGTPYEVEHRICRPDGILRYVISKGQAMFDDQQQVVKLYGTVLDITDRKQLEQSLRSQAEEERLLASITQNIRQSLDLNQILATTVVEVQQTLKADRALIFRLKPHGSGEIIQEVVVPEYPAIKQMHWEDEHFPNESYAYYQQGTPRIVPDV
ncbi:MAG TPA: PAS domain S-box protein, partial [Allocoleopsis sp.]